MYDKGYADGRRGLPPDRELAGEHAYASGYRAGRQLAVQLKGDDDAA